MVQRRWNVMADGTIMVTDWVGVMPISRVLCTDEEQREYEWAVLSAVAI
jgi:hypothetical protein